MQSVCSCKSYVEFGVLGATGAHELREVWGSSSSSWVAICKRIHAHQICRLDSSSAVVDGRLRLQAARSRGNEECVSISSIMKVLCLEI